jgi:hypothetical protein
MILKEEILWKSETSELGILEVTKIRRVFEENGIITDNYERQTITPDDDFEVKKATIDMPSGIASKLRMNVESVRLEAIAVAESIAAAEAEVVLEPEPVVEVIEEMPEVIEGGVD